MELIVFDLDGTLLDARSQVSGKTAATLRQLRERGIAYTVATGRTLHGARDLLEGHGFSLPHIYKNGVMIWQPESDDYSSDNLLTLEEIRSVVEAFLSVDVTPFIFTLEPGNRHVVYHAPLRNAAERRLEKLFANDRGMELLPVASMPAVASITNISALGSPDAIGAVTERVRSAEHLVAYAGAALEGEGLHWVDIHHSAASKGGAVAELKHFTDNPLLPQPLVILALNDAKGESAVETCRLLHEIDPQVKVIAMSGTILGPVMENCQKYGFINTLPKPFSMDSLKHITNTVLHS